MALSQANRPSFQSMLDVKQASHEQTNLLKALSDTGNLIFTGTMHCNIEITQKTIIHM